MRERYDELLLAGERAVGADDFARAAELFAEAESVARELGEIDLADRAFCNRCSVLVEIDQGADQIPRLKEILLSSGDTRNRFLAAYGSPNFIRTPSIQDSYELSLYLTQGVRAMPGFDLSQSDFILSFGSGLIEGWQSPVYMFRSRSTLVANNGRMIQVEPRLSKTAAKSEEWVAVKPGTEGALALGIAHEIIKKKLYHREFIDNYASGFAAYEKQIIDGYPPEIVSKMTGLSTKTFEMKISWLLFLIIQLKEKTECLRMLQNWISVKKERGRTASRFPLIAACLCNFWPLASAGIRPR